MRINLDRDLCDAWTVEGSVRMIHVFGMRLVHTWYRLHLVVLSAFIRQGTERLGTQKRKRSSHLLDKRGRVYVVFHLPRAAV